MQPLINNLNPEQRAAVETTEGPLLILAGAGSGKTRVITSRVAWLIREKGVAPDSILAVTFTNKAASEMAERVDKLLGHSSLAKPLIATFHSMCVRMLRRDIEALKVGNEGLTRSFAIYDENDQQAIVKQVMRRMGLDIKQLTPRTVLGRISWAKNHMVDPQEYYLASKDPNSERIAHIYQSYKAELRKNNALDFDDLLLEAVRLLKGSSEVRERYQRKYKYLLVDEYQDTNRPQYELMKLLAGEAKNVCAVGDEDQSIYSWRGADIRNILEFEKDFPNARIVRLEQNYRSTQVILEAAGAVVANNVRRKGKKLWTDRQGGSLIGYYEAPDGENEALFIADRIQKFLRESGDAGDEAHCAVLYRTNSQSRLVEEALRRYNIRYTMVGGFSFYERAGIKDLLGYLRLVRNPHDSMALNRVINTPVRGIGKTTLETLERLALETGQSTWDALAAALRDRLIPARAQMALDSFRQLILDAQAMMDPDFAGKLSADVAAPAHFQRLGSVEQRKDFLHHDVDFAVGDQVPKQHQLVRAGSRLYLPRPHSAYQRLVLRRLRYGRYQAAAQFKDLPGSVLRLAADQVQNHIHALDDIFKAGGGVVDDLFGSEQAQEIKVAGGGGGDDPGALAQGQLHGKRPHSSSPAMNENFLAGPDFRQIKQSLPRRQSAQGRGRGVNIVHRRRFWGQIGNGNRDQFGERAARSAMAKNRLSHIKIRHPFSKGLDRAGKIAPQRSRQRQRSAFSFAHFPVEGIDTSRVNTNQNLIRPRLRRSHVFKTKSFRPAEGMDAHSFDSPRLTQYGIHTNPPV